MAVVEARSFTRAAHGLHLTQQSLSAAVASLERQLGVRLLERTRQGVEPTAAGEALRAAAPAVFAAIDEAERAVLDAGEEPHGALRLRYGADSEELSEALLSAFQERHRRITLTAWAGMDADNVVALRAGDADAILAWVSVPGDLNWQVVAYETAVIAMPDRHPLARFDAVPLSAVADEPLVMFPRRGAPAVWDYLVAALRDERAGRGCISELPVSGQASMASAVLRGAGICPISKSLTARVARPGLVLRALRPEIRVPLLLAWRDRPTKALQALAHDLLAPTGESNRTP